MTRQRHLVIAAGGTGGHMFPAQALAQEMLRRGWRVSLSTDERGLHYAGGFPKEVPRRALSAATFARGGIKAKMAAPFEILGGIVQALGWFTGHPPACVAGFGGYPALPALSAAWLLRKPRLIHEQNGVLGRVNKAFATRVDRMVCGTWPVSNAPDGAELVHLGNPVRDSVMAAMEAPYAAPAEGDPIRLLIFGGSQGASVFAEIVPTALSALPADLRARLRVVQQARKIERDQVAKAYKKAGVEADVAEFFDDMPARIAAAHLVICRAGASTVAELTAIGRPSILTPYPAAMDDHQTANAQPLADARAAILAPQADLTAEALSAQIAALLSDPAELMRMAAEARGLGRPDAAEKLADLVEALATR